MKRSEIDEHRRVRHATGGASADENAELARARATDPALDAELAALARVWEGLELPPPSAPPPGFADRVAARAAVLGTADRRSALGFRLDWATAATLAVGLALGGLLGGAWTGGSVTDGAGAAADSDEATLAESYLEAAATGGEMAVDETATPPASHEAPSAGSGS